MSFSTSQNFLGESNEMPAEQRAALQSALFHACQEGFTDGVRLLVQKGVNVNDSDDFGATPLHFAVFGNYPDIVEELLAARVMIIFLNFPNAALE